MPDTPSLAQSEASRQNGARSTGPATAAGKARSALNSVRHGLSGRTFFLLPDEDPAEFREHEAMWLAAWSPRDLYEHAAATCAIRAMWRAIRADRLEAQVLTDLFATGAIADETERQAAKAVAFKALGTLLRYRGRIEREHDRAMAELESLRQRRPTHGTARPSEPDVPAEPPVAAAPPRPTLSSSTPMTGHAERPTATAQHEPEPPPALNRHQRRALAAMSRRTA